MISFALRMVVKDANGPVQGSHGSEDLADLGSSTWNAFVGVLRQQEVTTPASKPPRMSHFKTICMTVSPCHARHWTLATGHWSIFPNFWQNASHTASHAKLIKIRTATTCGPPRKCQRDVNPATRGIGTLCTRKPTRCITCQSQSRLMPMLVVHEDLHIFTHSSERAYPSRPGIGILGDQQRAFPIAEMSREQGRAWRPCSMLLR